MMIADDDLLMIDDRLIRLYGAPITQGLPNAHTDFVFPGCFHTILNSVHQTAAHVR